MDSFITECTIISDITKILLNRLREGLVKDIIMSSDSINASNDFTQLGHILNLVLYNIVKLDPILFGDKTGNSLVLALEYMVAAESKDEASQKTFSEQVILGGVLKVFNDNPVISEPHNGSVPTRITLNNLSLEDKTRINTKTPALFYQVAPVIIKPAPRVEAVRVVQTG
jgi:hypothetical protein